MVAFLLLGAQIPLETRPHGIVSRIVLDGAHPAGNYVKYALQLVAAVLAATAVLARRGGGAPAAPVPSPAPPRGGWRGVLARAWVAALAAVALVALVNENLPAQLGHLLTDPFHEGETLGFLPAFRGAGEPFANAILIHGFALDIFPAIWTSRMRWGIAGARLVTTVLDVMAHVALFWVLREALRAGGKRVGVPLLLGFAAAYAVSYRLAWDLSRKDFLFFAQLGILLWTMRRAHAGRPALAGALAWGATLPLALLYSYDRALYSVGVALPFLLLALAFGPRELRRPVAAAAAGAGAGAALLWASVGTAGLASVVEQIGFWGQTGRFVWSVPILDPAWPESIRGPAWVAALILVYVWGTQGAAAGLLLRSALHRGLRSAWRAHYAEVALLGSSLLYMRVALDRSDLGHVQNGAIASLVLMAVLFLPRLQAQADGWRLGHRWGWAAVAVLVCLVLPVRSLRTPGMFDPAAAGRRLAAFATTAAAPDASVVPADYAAGARWVRQAAPADRCFYTLTSEGLWYYLLDRPACSPFHQILYARTPQADAQVAASLRESRPGVVLVSNNFWTNRVDGVTVYNTNPAVSRLVLAEYRPAHLVGEHWFWKRAGAPWRFLAAAPAGTLVRAPRQVGQRFDAALSGTLHEPAAGAATSAVLLVREADGIPLSAARVLPGARRWSADIPTAALPLGRSRVRAWLADGRTGTLRPLGPAIDLDVVPGRMRLRFRPALIP